MIKRENISCNWWNSSSIRFHCIKCKFFTINFKLLKKIITSAIDGFTSTYWILFSLYLVETTPKHPTLTSCLLYKETVFEDLL